MKHLFWFIGFIIVLWFLWFFTGGPQRYEERQSGKFIKPLQLDQPPETYN